jgi:hypothetical protein
MGWKGKGLEKAHGFIDLFALLVCDVVDGC